MNNYQQRTELMLKKVIRRNRFRKHFSLALATYHFDLVGHQFRRQS
jgi:hypothetical protein